MIEQGRLAGKVALVTGGARGIGRAIAERYLAEGARVVIGDVLEVEGRATAAALGAGCRFQRCDVSREEDAAALATAAVEAFGRVDVCVNNAAILRSEDPLAISAQSFRRVLEVNLLGSFLVAQAAARQMAAQGSGGAIVNLSSINARIALPGQTSYAASKGGIAMLTRSLAVQLADYGIRVNAIGPGTVATEMAAGFVDDTVLSRIAMRRPGEPREIAAIAAFLASDEASYVTGQTLYADGGRLAINLVMPPRREQTRHWGGEET